MPVGRFAPSPSGLMHLGNARTALLAWLDARSRRGRVVLRIEDLDRVRCTPAFADLVREDLRWLGLVWDEETSPQSTRDGAYAAAVAHLAGEGLVFRCFCSRRELALASAPHNAADAGRRCAGRCRALPEAEIEARVAAGRQFSLRVALPDTTVQVTDRLHGVIRENVARTVGDMVVRRADGLYAYQLAVVVDDAADGVTDVVRGDDLLASTARQVLLGRLLGLPTPTYAHVPLVVGPDGERLAKRHGAPSVAELRDRGMVPEELVGLLAGTAPAPAASLLGGFDLERISLEPLHIAAAV
jgi:glutamyl-tRNA synthetase